MHLKLNKLPTHKPLLRLYSRLFGKPKLIRPVPVIGGHRRVSPTEVAISQLPDDCLWTPYEKRKGVALSPPSDAEWTERYNARKDGHVTYSPKEAQARLLSLITADKLIIEPVEREGKLNLHGTN